MCYNEKIGKLFELVLLTSSLVIPVTNEANAITTYDFFDEIRASSIDSAESIVFRDEQEEATTTDSIYCSCVQTARIIGGLKVKGNAQDIKPNSPPVLNGGILFYYPNTRTHHIATIKEFRKNGFWVVEGNFGKIPCLLSERLVSYKDPFITGFVASK